MIRLGLEISIECKYAVGFQEETVVVLRDVGSISNLGGGEGHFEGTFFR